MQPRLREELVGRGGVAERVGGIVGREQVLDDRAGFPEGNVGVWVGDGGDAAVGVDGFEGFCDERVRFVCLFLLSLSVLGIDGSFDIPWCRTLKSMSSDS